jgi:predicted helicase
MSTLNLKPTHAPVKAYYATLEKFAHGKFDNEGNIRGAFEDLLKKCARQFDWLLVPEYRIPRKGKNPISIDAALVDDFNIPRAYWEAKDEKDNLEAESRKKFADGYPRANILFQKPTRALLVQNGITVFNDSIADPQKLVDVLALFFEYRPPHVADWESAVADFSGRIPDIAQGVLKLIEQERKSSNRRFQESFASFADLCRQSINPDLKDETVEEMLVQHLLTERIFRKVFNNPEFTRRNIIAAEIEKVIDSLTKKHFSRDAFLKNLDHFYKAIEEAAATLEDYSEKQHFLNRVYEKFFQGFSKKQADTHGIVYTPQPIVDFMVRSVEEVLQSEFGKSLSDSGVHILDPFTGTGNFITRIMREIQTSRLPQKYREELHCNEVMLLPYYIASMNIEHAYLERTNEYEPFEGICLVDTFELAEPKQAGFEFMTEGNTERIKKQKKAPIFVVIGNPPYNAWQENENDQNRNRKYPYLSARIAETYSKHSTATNKNALSDPYVKAFRWASDRIKAGGLVCFVSNDSFIDQLAFDGMRHCLLREFDKVYALDLGGNVRKNPKLSGTTHNVFGIQVGVSITILIRNQGREPSSTGTIFYARVPEDWRKEQKYTQLEQWDSLHSIQWKRIRPDDRNTWLTTGLAKGWDALVPLREGIFEHCSNGVKTNRDAWVYSFQREELIENISRAIAFYNQEYERWWRQKRQKKELDGFLSDDSRKISWSETLKKQIERHIPAAFDSLKIRKSLYRPFVKQFLYFDAQWNERRYQMQQIFPSESIEQTNRLIWIKTGTEVPMFAVATNSIPNGLPQGGSQCFPFYTYDEDGSNRRENITDWALEEFRKHYADKKISKWDIFHATYAILHHPEYRARYAANLKRELPRIPFVPEFRQYAKIGESLMKLHIDYERQKEYPLQRAEKGKLNWRVEKMKLSKDKTQLTCNDFLTLSGIPPEVYEYRLGNRPALEWIVDQYRVSTDARSGIVNDPNRDDDPEYIVRLIGQVVTVSLETVKLVRDVEKLKLLPPAE